MKISIKDYRYAGGYFQILGVVLLAIGVVLAVTKHTLVFSVVELIGVLFTILGLRRAIRYIKLPIPTQFRGKGVQ